MKKVVFTIIGVLIFLQASLAQAAVSSNVVFNVDQDYDTDGRQKLEATLVKAAPNLYFYIEKDWWGAQSEQAKQGILSGLDGLSNEFDSNIYPVLTSWLGNEWNPGIDNDHRITVLFHDIKNPATGYVRSADEYSNLQAPGSNQREMVYLSTDGIASSHLKEFLAHEFTHLIIFNQKEKIRGVHEEVWLSEAIADYSATLLGYNQVYQGSNLQRRVEDFLQRPDDSLTEWQNTRYDYAVASVFTHYLVDHYGVGILADVVKSEAIGITGLNRALLAKKAPENFSQIFTNWTITMVVNNCSLGTKYCYRDKNLVNFRINPSLVFLPMNGTSSLSTTNFTKGWSGNWQKIVGGSGNLKLQFAGKAGLVFRVPYVLVDKAGVSRIKFLPLDKNQVGQIVFDGFSDTYSSLFIMPSLEGKMSGFLARETAYPFDVALSTFTVAPPEEGLLVQELLAQIDMLKKQIAALQGVPASTGCGTFQTNLYMGIANRGGVTCLQQFLKSQGPSVYPEGLVTGYFGPLTRAAVIRLQAQHGILQTGYVGTLTRAKINSLLK